MTCSLVACGVASLLTTASPAETLRGYAEIVGSNQETFDPSIFGPGPNVDIWYVILENNTEQDVTSLELSFPGEWVNQLASTGGLAFRDTLVLPITGPNFVAETFFLLPVGTTPLDVGTVDTDELLQSSYTVAGDTALVPAGGAPTIVAVLAVLTGEPVDATRFSGRGAVGGEFIEIAFPVPEPSAACCVAMALASVAVRRARPEGSGAPR